MMIFEPYPNLKTNNLVLRKLDNTDIYSIFNYRVNKDNFKYVDMPVYKDINEAKEYVNKMNQGVKDGKWIIWAITDKSNKILGTISLWNISNDLTKAELGYGLFPGNTGKGIMNEALKEVIKYGFNDMKLSIIEAYTSVNNKKSISLLERNNFQFQFKIKERTFSGITEMFVFSLKNSDFNVT